MSLLLLVLLGVHQVRHARGGAHRLLDDQLRVQDVELLLGDLRHVVQVLLQEVGEDNNSSCSVNSESIISIIKMYV